MASLLQRSASWIESTFLYASTVFDPDSINVDNGGGEVDSTGKAHNNAEEEEEEKEEEAPQTEDTIPSGLVSSQRWYNNDNNSINGDLNGGPQQRRSNTPPPPSRRGKFVQVLHSGGNLDYLTNTTTNNNDSSSSSSNTNSTASAQSLPPHLVISDGEYCCIAFLSPETCVAYHNEQIIKNGQRGPCHLPSRRSIVGISQYTVSTILQCCRQSAQSSQCNDDDINSPLAAAVAQTTHNSNNCSSARRESSSSSMDKSRSRDSDITVPLPIDLQVEMNSAIQRQYEADMHYQIMSQLLFTDIPIHYNATGPYNRNYAAAPAPAISANQRAGGRSYQVIPPEIQRQLRTQIPDIQLYLCLFIQGPITFVGAENGGLIGDPIDVHCSVTLRRGLMHHLHLYGSSRSRNNNDNSHYGEGYSHTMLIQRLEACHNYYHLLDHINSSNNNDNGLQQQQQLIRGGGGDVLQDESDDENTDDEHGVVRKKRKTKKKKYGKGNTKRVVLGGGRERRGGNNNDRDNSSSSGSSSSTMKWPWKSCLTITQDIPIVPPRSLSPPIDEILGIGTRNDDLSKNSITDAAATAIGGGREAESINVQIIMQNNNTAPPSPVFGVRGKSIATGHGNVTELFDSTQDIFDILGLEVDYDPIDPVTTTTITADAVNNNNASVENNNDKNDTNEMDSFGEDSGPTFVGIDDMIIDDDEEEELANTVHHQEINFGNEDGMTQDYLFTQPPDAVSRRVNDNDDAVSLSSSLDDEESTSPTHRCPRRMPRRNLPRTSSPLPSRPVRSTTRNKKVVVNQQQAVEKEDVPINTNHTEQQQQQQQQERPKRGRRKPRDTIQIPIQLRKAPPETLGLASTTALSLARTEEVEVDDNEEEEGVYREESQIPIQHRDDEEEVEEDTAHYESQIPLMTRMTKKSKLTNDELIGHVDQQHEQYDVMESQLPLPQRPSRATLPSSQKNRNDNDDDSEDSEDLMRIRRTKPKADEWMKVSKGKSVSSAATAVLAAAAAAADSSDESTTTDLFVESQIAGEGSDETFSPPSPMPSDSKSPLRNTRTSAVAAAAAAATTNQDIDQYSNDHHSRVRFAIDQTTTTNDNHDVSLRILNKIDRILGLDTGAASTSNNEERKRTASETFNITQFMDKVKRLCGA